MIVDTEKENICVNKIVQEKTENAVIEGDSIVPDVKPDVISVIKTCGNICIYKKEIMDGKVRIDGSIDTYVMYITESETGMVRGLNTSIDFTHTIEMDRCTNDMNLELCCDLKSIDTKVLNGRKINIKANVEFLARVYQNKDEQVIKEIVGVTGIQKQNKILQINSLVGRGNTKINCKDNIAINENDNLAEILQANCYVLNKEFKTSYNKILVKAESVVKIMYLTEENTINNVEANIAVMGFIDIPNVSEDNMCDIQYNLKNMLIKPQSTDEHSIGIELEFDVDGSAYTTKDIEIVEDLYNPNYDIKYTTKKLETISDKNKCKQSVYLDEAINMLDTGCENIYNVEVTPTITNVNTINEKLIYEGEVNVNIIFQTNNVTGIDTKNVIIPFNAEIPIGKMNDNSKVNTSVEVKNKQENLNNGNMELKMELELLADTYKPVNLELIDSLEMEEYEDKSKYGMSIYFVKKGDTLWKIAKRFRTTVDEIVSANNIEDPNRINVGEQLFIPKTNSNKREKLA